MKNDRMKEVIDDLLTYSSEGVISLRIANDLVNRAHACGVKEGIRLVISAINDRPN